MQNYLEFLDPRVKRRVRRSILRKVFFWVVVGLLLLTEAYGKELVTTKDNNSDNGGKDRSTIKLDPIKTVLSGPAPAHYLTVTIQITFSSFREQEIQRKLSRARHQISLYVSGLSLEDVSSPANKSAVLKEIKRRIAQSLSIRIEDITFEEFILSFSHYPVVSDKVLFAEGKARPKGKGKEKPADDTKQEPATSPKPCDGCKIV
jgi:flagellar basal body-associated protein FliL